MLKKIFIQVGFYDELDYWDEFIENRSKLEKYGYFFKIYTPLDLKGSSNVETIKINLDWWNDLLSERLGVKPGVKMVFQPYRNGKGDPIWQPSKWTFHYWPTFGELFPDDIKGYDYWGHIGFNLVLGNLNNFIPDDFLKECDIFSDDTDMIGGPLTLYRNDPKINSLFRKCNDWRWLLDMSENHFDFGEHYMTEVALNARNAGSINFVTNNNHSSGIAYKLSWKDDKLIDELKGKEISFFHFTRTKTWPEIPK